jgi:hypothetical protein
MALPRYPQAAPSTRWPPDLGSPIPYLVLPAETGACICHEMPPERDTGQNPQGPNQAQIRPYWPRSSPRCPCHAVPPVTTTALACTAAPTTSAPAAATTCDAPPGPRPSPRRASPAAGLGGRREQPPPPARTRHRTAKPLRRHRDSHATAPLIKRAALTGHVGPRQVLRVRGDESVPPLAPGLCPATQSGGGEEGGGAG